MKLLITDLRLYHCICLWMFVTIATFLVASICRHHSKKIYKAKKYYIYTLINEYSNLPDLLESIDGVYYSLGRNNWLAKIIGRGMKLLKNPYKDVNDVALYIENKMNCYPIVVIHRLMEVSEGHPLSDSVKEILQEIVNTWQKENYDNYRMKAVQWIILVIHKEILFALNLFIYEMLKDDISLFVLVIINTLGLILLIRFDFNWYVDDYSVNKKHLDFLIWSLHICSLSDRYSIQNAIRESFEYSTGDMSFKIRNLNEVTSRYPDSVKPYHDFCQELMSDEAYEIMTVLYEYRNECGNQVQKELFMVIKDFVGEEYVNKKINNKAQARAGRIRSMYQLAGCMGLMINTVTILVQWSLQAV